MKQSTSTYLPEASASSYGRDIDDEFNDHSLPTSSSCDNATMSRLVRPAAVGSARPDDENDHYPYNNNNTMGTVENYSQQHNCSSSASRRTVATKIAVLTLLLFVAAVAIISNNNQVQYDDTWNTDNNVISDSTTAGRRRDSTGGTTTAITSTSTSSSSTTSTLLTRTSQLSSLLSNLDASDVIECYIVTRMANLANVEAYSSSSGKGSGVGGGNNHHNNNHNYSNRRRNIQTMEKENNENGNDDATMSTSSSFPTGPVLIRKAALAFRYRPKVASVSHVAPGSTASSSSLSANNDQSDATTTTATLDQQKYFELTLEYGPQRAGATKTSESMPMVHIDMEVMANYNNDDENGGGGGLKYVSWDNQGSIYYSTHISNEWSGAYYMAPITGVVLEKILEKAVEYPTKRPRYQPFEVVSIPSNTVILKSSGSDDFVWDMLKDLADLYVDIDPILVPPRGKVQFYVADPIVEGGGVDNNNGNNKDVEGSSGGTRSNVEVMRQKRRRPNPNVKRVVGALESSKAAVFYENFFNCANAKKTGDYSLFEEVLVSSAPTPVPPVLEGEDVVISNTTTSLGVSKEDEVDDGLNRDGSIRRLDGSSNSTIASTTSSEVNVDAAVDVKGGDNSTDSSAPTTESGDVTEIIEEVGDVAKTAEDVVGVATEGDIDKSSPPPLIDDDDDYEIKTINTDEANTDSEDDGDVAKAAEKAAIEAAQKAETAAAVAATNSSSPEDSAKAASEAAIAAKKAADASHASRAKSAAEGLLSGDGAMMTSILSSCFSDPKYGIRKVDEEQSSTTYAYVYLDGDVFIRLNLTAPYWGPSTVLQTIPPPHAHVDGQGDVVDWAIFLLLICGTVFGFLVMVHQLGVSIDDRLQFRHVFHPLEDSAIIEMERLEMGGGIPHSIGIDAIPVSLGGQLSHYNGSQGEGPPSTYKDRLSESSIDDDENNGLLGIELANRKNAVSVARLQKRNSDGVRRVPSRLLQRRASDGVSSPEAAASTRNDLPLSLRLKEEAPDLVERPTLKSKSKVALPHSSPGPSPRLIGEDKVLSDEKKTNMPVLPKMT